jgi:hypothetical protein
MDVVQRAYSGEPFTAQEIWQVAEDGRRLDPYSGYLQVFVFIGQFEHLRTRYQDVDKEGARSATALERIAQLLERR